MAIEIVVFPIKYGGSFQSYLYVYQRGAVRDVAVSSSIAQPDMMSAVVPSYPHPKLLGFNPISGGFTLVN